MLSRAEVDQLLRNNPNRKTPLPEASEALSEAIQKKLEEKNAKTLTNEELTEITKRLRREGIELIKG